MVRQSPLIVFCHLGPITRSPSVAERRHRERTRRGPGTVDAAMARPTPERLRAALDAQLTELGRTGVPPDARLEDALVDAVLAAYDAGDEPVRPAARLAVKVLLDRLATDHPGRSVEVRVPPY